MIINFFGASVTQQNKGYVYYFKNKCSDNITIFQNGYGSMHINDAGICFLYEIIKKALRYKPNYICIVPENRKEITTEGGLNIKDNYKKLKEII